ncbi:MULTISPECIES: acyltransferase family protein [Legionella]|uniref:O-antigen acetylase n=1 Tax=Legionella drozanskii LLAP-1 TaxID=1212489 RepID=A0A0W0SS09_9GAMM|nr:MULTISPECIES: acyltransferase family protein [Legionella]KTC86052.1 O-antigen acetylase [Legionella drozanskii LLAP-1]PJE10564.1 MAG: acyltransferase [Legionella sp.]
MASSYPKYRPDIDGLRAIAVLSVVFFHAFPTLLKGGFIGVDIFFVISGFLISTIIFGHLEQNSFKVTEFYSRRIKRIFPALLLVLLSCYLLGWFALFAQEYKQLGKHIFSGAGFISNIILWTESGYFDNTAETKPLLHLWSLGIEEQFYIVWPLLLYFAWKRKMNILLVIAAVCLISFSLNIGRVHRDIIGAFYAPQTRFWELWLGSLLAYLSLYPQKFTAIVDKFKLKVAFPKLSNATAIFSDDARSILGGILILSGILFIIKERAFPGWWALLPSLGAVLIISAGPNTWINRKILSNKLLVWFGLISFPLYLWHWPLLAFVRIVEGQTPKPEIRFLIVLVSIAFAWLTYELLEKPIRHRGQKKIVILLLVLMVTIGCIGRYCYKQDGFLARPIMKNAAKINEQFVGPLWKYTKNDFCLNRYPFAETKNYGWWFCMITRDEKPSLLLLGDSLANQLYAGLSQHSIFSKNNILSIGTCDPAEVDPATVNKDYNRSPCSGDRPLHQQKFINQIIEKNSDSLKYAILSLSGVVNDPNYIQRLKKRVDFLEKNHLKVIIFMRPLAFADNIQSCFSRPFKMGSQTKCESSLEQRKDIKTLFKPLKAYFAKSNPKVIFFDQNDLFCDHEKCSMVRNGMPLMRDDVHISEYASIEVSKIFAKWVKKHVPEMLA